MPIIFCRCGQVLSCHDDLAGQRVTCPECRAEHLVPRGATSAAPPSASSPPDSGDLLGDLGSVGLAPEEPAPARPDLNDFDEDRTPYAVHESAAGEAVAGVVGEVGTMRLSRERSCQRLAYGADHLTALAALGDTVHVVHLRSLKRVGKFEEHRAPVTCLALSADCRQALSGDEDGIVWLWDVTRAQPVRRLTAHARAVGAAAFFASGKVAVTGGADGRTRLWKLDTGEEFALAQAHWQAPVRCVACSPDARLVLAGSGHGLVYVWSLHNGAPCQRLTLNTPVDSAVFSSDARAAVTGCLESQTIARWDLTSGKCLAELEIDEDEFEIDDVLVVPGGLRAVTVGTRYPQALPGTIMEREVRIPVLQHWSLAKGQDLNTFEYGQPGHIAMAVVPDGTRCLTSGQDGRLRIWGL